MDCLVGVSLALPERLQALPHVCDAVNLFAMPSTLDGVARSGRLDLLQLHAESIPCTPSSIAGAAANGHLQTVQWLYEIAESRQLGRFLWASAALQAAAGTGQMEVIKWFQPKGPFQSCVGKMSVAAATSGQLGVIQWLMEKYPSVEKSEPLAAALVAANGDVEAFLMSNCGDNAVARALGSALNTLACGNCIERVKAIWERCMLDDVRNALMRAVRSDAYDVMKFL